MNQGVAFKYGALSAQESLHLCHDGDYLNQLNDLIIIT